MERNRKNIFLWIYYLGLVLGIFWMNYACASQAELVEGMIESFQSLDKFSLISREEYFFYLLFLRGRQFLFLFCCYLFFPKRLFLLLLEFYASFCLGSFLSLEAYHQGFSGIVMGIAALFPQFLCYGMIYFLAVYCQEAGKRKPGFNQKKMAVVSIFLCLAGCVLEAYVNSVLVLTLIGKK